MTIKQVNGRFHIDTTGPNGHRIRKCTQATSKAEAKRIEIHARMHGILPGGDPKPLQGPTIGDLYREALKTVWRDHKSLRSFYVAVGGPTVKLIGEDLPMVKLDRDRLELFINDCLEIGNAPSTINRKLTIIKELYRLASHRGIVDGQLNFSRLCRKEFRGRTRYVTPEEEGRMLAILEAAGRDQFAILVRVLIGTGMRLSEALDMSWADIGSTLSGEWFVHVQNPKNDQPRTIPLIPPVVKAIQKLMELDQGSPFGHWTVSAAEYNWAWLRKQMQLDGDKEFCLHCLRHTCASRLAQAGVDIRVIQQWLGHQDIRNTARYSHLNPVQMSRAAQVLAGAYQS